MQRTLISTCYAAADPAAGLLRNGWKRGDPLPTRLRLLAKGDNPSTKLLFRVTDATLAGLAGFQKERGLSRVPVDFQHNTFPGSDEYLRTQEPRTVAAFADVTATPEGIISLDNIAWTAAGLKDAENFDDLSPVIFHRPDGEVLGIHSVALVRNGAVHGLTLCATDPNEETTTMEKLQQLIDALTARLDAIEQKFDGISADACTAASALLKPVTDEIAVFRARDVAREKEHLIQCAMLEGKNVSTLTPATVTALSVDDLKQQLSKLKPGEIPLTALTIDRPPPAAAAGPSEQQREIASRMGLDPAKVAWKA